MRLFNNPALHEIGAETGWVIDSADGEPAAFLGNLIHKFVLGDQVFHGATGYSLIVRPDMRGRSRDLLETFVTQKDVFTHYTLDANPLSSPLYQRFGMRPWPPQVNALKLSWIVDPIACLRGRINRQVIADRPALIRLLGEQMLNRSVGSERRLALPSGVAVLSDLGDHSPLADFWAALRQENALFADRSPATLRWLLSDPDMTVQPLLLSFTRDDRMTGFALAMVGKGMAIEPPVLEIIDLTALQGETAAVPALMQALIGAARSMGAAKLRAQVVSAVLLERLGSWAARARREGGWGHCHAHFNNDAPDPALWSPTALEGAYTISVRQPPLTRTMRQPAAPGHGFQEAKV